jgi:hypothetical protein
VVQILRKLIILAVFILISVVATGCTSSAYKDYMEKGNKAMDAGEYAAAVEMFSLAVKEEPKEKEVKDKLQTAKDLKLIEEMKADVKEGKKAIEEKEYSKGIKVLKDVIKEKTKSEQAKEIQSDTTEYLDSIRKEIVEQIQGNLEEARKALESGNYEIAGTLMTLTELNLLDNKVKEFILEKEDIKSLLPEIDEISKKAKNMKEAKDLEIAQKKAEEQKRIEEENKRKEQEQRELEFAKQHPERLIKISDIKVEKIESWDSFDVNFKVTNTSNITFDRVEYKVTLLDSNNKPMTSEPVTSYSFPAGEYEQKSITFFDQSPDGLNIKVEVTEATNYGR